MMKHIVAALILVLCFAAPAFGQARTSWPTREEIFAQITPLTLPDIRKKADQGDADAQFKLGLAYLNGGAAGRDDEQALKWLGKSADQGQPMAQFVLGVSYALTGNETAALPLINRSAEQGFPPAQELLRRMKKLEQADKPSGVQNAAQMKDPKTKGETSK